MNVNLKNQVDRILGKMKQLNIVPNKTVSLEKIERWENESNIKLPITYKAFLTQIQNGGTSNQLDLKGPYYGIYSFEESINENTEWEINISKPFGFIEDFEFEKVCDLETDYELHMIKLDKDLAYKNIIEKYQNTEILQGTLPICQYGCGDFFRLVINGEKAGQIFAECGIINLTGYYFLNVDILIFYEKWLDRQINTDDKTNFIDALYPFLEFGENDKYDIT